MRQQTVGRAGAATARHRKRVWRVRLVRLRGARLRTAGQGGVARRERGGRPRGRLLRTAAPLAAAARRRPVDADGPHRARLRPGAKGAARAGQVGRLPGAPPQTEATGRRRRRRWRQRPWFKCRGRRTMRQKEIGVARPGQGEASQRRPRWHQTPTGGNQGRARARAWRARPPSPHRHWPQRPAGGFSAASPRPQREATAGPSPNGRTGGARGVGGRSGPPALGPGQEALGHGRLWWGQPSWRWRRPASPRLRAGRQYHLRCHGRARLATRRSQPVSA